MATDPRKLRPSELCRLLNSTPLGEVLSDRRLHRHRTRAGLRVGDGRHVDLVRYVAWLVQQRHTPKTRQDSPADIVTSLEEIALGAAAVASANHASEDSSNCLTSKQEALIAALLTESSHTAAAAKAGVGYATMYRWLRMPAFRAAHRQARRELMESAVGRMQVASGQAVDILLNVARQGRRDGDRVRAAIAILDRAMRGLEEADLLQGDSPVGDDSPLDTTGVVQLVATRLRQLDQSALPTAEKSRLTAMLSEVLLRAIGVDVLDKRLESLQAVLDSRKEKKR